VPSDLEQMPNLLNFLEDKGTLFTNHYTPLISHTAVDILTALTGVSLGNDARRWESWLQNKMLNSKENKKK